eukprot:356690-Chlamydomonas_euryale.AAC.2
MDHLFPAFSRHASLVSHSGQQQASQRSCGHARSAFSCRRADAQLQVPSGRSRRVPSRRHLAARATGNRAEPPRIALARFCSAISCRGGTAAAQQQHQQQRRRAEAWRRQLRVRGPPARRT